MTLEKSKRMSCVRWEHRSIPDSRNSQCKGPVAEELRKSKQFIMAEGSKQEKAWYGTRWDQLGHEEPHGP